MGAIDLVALVVAGGLLVYLTFALLKAEWFS